MQVLVMDDKKDLFEYSYKNNDSKVGISEYINVSNEFNKKHLQDTIIALESALNYARMKYKSTFQYA